MPRARQSSAERRATQARRKARWRSQVGQASHAPASPFIPYQPSAASQEATATGVCRQQSTSPRPSGGGSCSSRHNLRRSPRLGLALGLEPNLRRSARLQSTSLGQARVCRLQSTGTRQSRERSSRLLSTSPMQQRRRGSQPCQEENTLARPYSAEEDGVLPDFGSQEAQEEEALKPASVEDDDDFLSLSNLANSPESLHAFVEDEEEWERREIARASIAVGVEEIDLTAAGESEDDSSMAELSREEGLVLAEEQDIDDDRDIQEQLQQEMNQSQGLEDAETNLPLELGLHLLDFHGCSEGSHRQARQAHFASSDPDFHYSLADLERVTGRLPDVINNPKIMTSNSQPIVEDADWPKIFEGRLSDREEEEKEEGDHEDEAPRPPRINVCLACSEQRHRPQRIRFDIDSVIGFASSLAFARRGVKINFAPQFHENLQTSVHLTHVVQYDSGRGPRPIHVKLHEIPHYCFGRVIGQEDMAIYILFPNQWTPEKPTNFPGKLNGQKHGTLQAWTDSILLPALAAHLPADIAQHMSASFKNAQLSAKAANREAQARVNKNNARHQSKYDIIPPDLLERIWAEIQHRAAEFG